MENFYTLLSNTGINAIIAARASNSEVKLTKIAVGDGDIIPSQDMTALKSEKHRFNINSIIQDIDNPNYLIVEGVIPSNVGGFYVSEVAIYTDQNTLFAIGSLPKTYKPLLEEGSAKDLTIKIFLEITNADSVTLKVDDSVVLATRKFVLSELKKYALINGDETKRFKVADATEPNEAISKKQFDDNKFDINTLPNKGTPIDTDNFAIQESGRLLKKLSFTNLKESLKSIFLTKPELITITGSSIFNGTTQNISMTNIGNISLAIGNVIEVAGTVHNNKLFTVESIVDVNNIVVNYEHRGTTLPASEGRLINETVTCTVKLYNRAKNAPNGQGQYWCDPASGRVAGQNYTNLTNRELETAITINGVVNNSTFNAEILTNNKLLAIIGGYGGGYRNGAGFSVSKNDTYRVNLAHQSSIFLFKEKGNAISK